MQFLPLMKWRSILAFSAEHLRAFKVTLSIVLAVAFFFSTTQASRCHLEFKSPKAFQDFIASIQRPRLEKLKSEDGYLRTELYGILSRLDDPYTFGYDLAKTSVERNHEVERFFETVYSSRSEPELFRHLSHWIKSDRHALFFYDLAYRSESNLLHNILKSLIASQRYYENVTYGITYSFEKEEELKTAKGFADWYRLKKFSEQEWRQKSPAKRVLKLYESFADKKFNEDIMATSNKPSYLGPLKIDGHVLEVTHKHFEIDPRKIFLQLREVSGAGNNTRSIHIHLVTALPEDYDQNHFNAFINWFKTKNDKLILMGLEEGLHPGHLINLAVNPFREKARFHADSLPEALVGAYESKMLALGFRTSQTYKAPERHMGQVTFGLELREGTPHLPRLEKMIANLTSEIKTRAWEGWTTEDGVRANTFEIPNQEILFSMLRDMNFNKAFKQMIISNPASMIPFVEMENQSFYNYKSKKIRFLNEQEKKQIIEARKKYFDALKSLEKEFLSEMSDDTGRLYTYTITGLKWCLADWAFDLAPSQFFE